MSGEAGEGRRLYLAIVCESPRDRETAAALADRVLSQEADLEAHTLDRLRFWGGLPAETSYLDWHVVAAERKKRKSFNGGYGKFQGEPGAQDARMARTALLLFNGVENRPEAVVLVRDDDRKTERRTGLEQARREREWPFEVVLGLAHPERESWVLAGFEPETPRETDRLQGTKKQLGFDPRTSPHRLNDPQPGQPRHRKTVLKTLTDGDLDRERACWEASPLLMLEERGRETGLAEFLDEVRVKLVPLFR